MITLFHEDEDCKKLSLCPMRLPMVTGAASAIPWMIRRLAARIMGVVRSCLCVRDEYLRDIVRSCSYDVRLNASCGILEPLLYTATDGSLAMPWSQSCVRICKMAGAPWLRDWRFDAPLCLCCCMALRSGTHSTTSGEGFAVIAISSHSSSSICESLIASLFLLLWTHRDSVSVQFRWWWWWWRGSV